MEIKIENLQKYYGNKEVLERINLELGHGIHGLLGKNGAGKSTLMKLLATISSPSKGRILYDGQPVTRKNVANIRSVIGYLPQDFDFYPQMTVGEVLDYLGALSLLRLPERKKRIELLLERLNLQEQKNVKFRQLSGGMKKRVGLAQALLTDPGFLIVDEPTAGLDPEERIRIRNLLCEFATDRIVLLSTHIVEDIEMTSDYVTILNQGRQIFDGDLESLRSYANGKVFLVEIPRSEVKSFAENQLVTNIQYHNEKAICRVLLREKGISLGNPQVSTVEDGYMALVEGGIADVVGN